MSRFRLFRLVFLSFTIFALTALALLLKALVFAMINSESLRVSDVFYGSLYYLLVDVMFFGILVAIMYMIMTAISGRLIVVYIGSAVFLSLIELYHIFVAAPNIDLTRSEGFTHTFLNGRITEAGILFSLLGVIIVAAVPMAVHFLVNVLDRYHLDRGTH